MAASGPRPMRIGASASSARSPWFSPSTTSTWVGAPRRARGGFGGRASRLAAAARAPSGMRAPNMSDRITDSADSTKIQRIARYASLMRNSVSSDTAVLSRLVVGDRLLGDPHRDGRVADLHPAAVLD